MYSHHATMDEHIKCTLQETKNGNPSEMPTGTCDNYKLAQYGAISPHYIGGDKLADLIREFGLNFNKGCSVKYLCRAGKKEAETEAKDLIKAIDYIRLELKHHNLSENEKQQLYKIVELLKPLIL